MNAPPVLEFKVASREEEFEAIHRLNYRTFVEEIPQHPAGAEPRLVDKFHAENTYVICLRDGRLIGSVAFRGRRPFSLDAKLPDLDAHLPPGRRPCEIRLLAVEKEHRNGVVLRGLLEQLARLAIGEGYDLGVISGTTRQLRLYRHLGFTPFGPLVGTPGAQYQPMLITLEAFRDTSRAFFRPEAQAATGGPANFLPGPVAVHADVSTAFARPAISHRGEAFRVLLSGVREKLAALARAAHAEVLVGSGTLANDAVGGQLRLLDQPGLVLANGEFGERLADHARRWGLDAVVHRRGWGEPFDLAAIGRELDARTGVAWLWAVHHETSTGMLNDLGGLRALCAERGLRLCLDCVSSFGTVPLDLRGVHLAAAASGKGLAAYPGLALVLSAERPTPAPAVLPRYLDLGLYAENDGVAFTHSSNLVAALAAALPRATTARFARIAAAATRLRASLLGAGLVPVTGEAHASPAIVTLAVPAELDSRQVARRLEERGWLVSHASGYLIRRNWIQVALMGEFDDAALDRLADELPRALRPRPGS